MYLGTAIKRRSCRWLRDWWFRWNLCRVWIFAVIDNQWQTKVRRIMGLFWVLCSLDFGWSQLQWLCFSLPSHFWLSPLRLDTNFTFGSIEWQRHLYLSSTARFLSMEMWQIYRIPRANHERAAGWAKLSIGCFNRHSLTYFLYWLLCHKSNRKRFRS